MEWIFAGFVVIIIIYVIVDKLKQNRIVQTDEDITVKMETKFPYIKRDDFLTEAERSFYFTLKVYIQDKAVICPKVSLKDIVAVDKTVGKEYIRYFRRIAQKHVDFTLCDPSNMRPICCVELDDSSHSQTKRQERDIFMDRVFEKVNMKLIHVPLKNGYSNTDLNETIALVFTNAISTKDDKKEEINTSGEIICPKCGAKMILRTSTKGENTGKQFYGCSNFPQCREVKNIN